MNVKIADQALHDLENLNGDLQERVLTVVERLKQWPVVSGAKPLVGNWRGHYRIRTGDYRVVFQVQADRVVVVRVAHRRDVYE